MLAEVVWGYFLTSAALVARGAAGFVIYVLCCHFFDFTAKVTVGVTNVAPLVARVIVNMFIVWMLPFCNQCNIGMFYGDSFKVPIGAFPAPADELIAYPCRITGRLKDVSKTDFSFKRIFFIDLERNSNVRTASGKTNCQQSEANAKRITLQKSFFIFCSVPKCFTYNNFYNICCFKSIGIVNIYFKKSKS